MEALERKKFDKASFRQALSASSTLPTSARRSLKRPLLKVAPNEGPIRKSTKLVVSSSDSEKVKPTVVNQVKSVEDEDMEEDDNRVDEEERKIINRAIKTDFSRILCGDKTSVIKDVDKINAKAALEPRTDPDGESDGKEDILSMPKPKELPKGFFDDPKAEAKMRNIPYKDPIDEEMNLFKKAIAEESLKAKTEVEESLEDIQIDRDYEEIREQINKWAKVNELQVQAEKLKQKMAFKEKDSHNNEEDEDDLDLSEINVFSRWRTKSIVQESR